MRQLTLIIILSLLTACAHVTPQSPTPPTEITLVQENLHGRFPDTLLDSKISVYEPALQSTELDGMRLVTLPSDFLPVTSYYWLFPNNDREAGILFGKTLLQDPGFKTGLRRFSMTLSVDSRDEFLLFSGQVPSKYFSGGMALLVGSLKEAELTPQYFDDALLENRVIGIISGRDTDTRVLNALHQLLYPEGHPLKNRYKRAGTEDVDLGSVKKFRQEKIVSATSTLILQSDQTHERLAGMLTEVLGNVPWSIAKRTPVDQNSKFKLAENRKPIIHIIDRPGSVQSSIGLGWLTVDLTHKDYPALGIFSRVLYYRLFSDVRETHGWTYGIFTIHDPSSYTAPFIIYTFCSNQHTAACLSAILKHVSYGSSELIGDKELVKAKTGVIADLNRDLNDPLWLALQIARLDGLAPFNRWYQKCGEAYQSLTADDIRKAVSPYLHMQPVIVILGDKDAIESQIDQYFPEYSIQYD